MGKNLSDMTLEELWELFPIILTEHKTEWMSKYEEMSAALREKLSAYKIIRISHIGSTAISSIWDILPTALQILFFIFISALSGIMTNFISEII